MTRLSAAMERIESPEDECISVLVALGSNVEPERHMLEALQSLRAQGGLLAVSQLYRSAAVLERTDSPPSPDFLNAAVRLKTRRSPREFKYEVLRPIEATLGRVRSGDRYAPRPIDLDIALCGDLVISEDDLQIPDPEIAHRAYLAVPLAEVAPHWRHPVDGRTLETLAASLRPHDLVATPWIREGSGAA